MATRPSSGKKKGDIWVLDLLQVKRKETYGY